MSQRWELSAWRTGAACGTSTTGSRRRREQRDKERSATRRESDGGLSKIQWRRGRLDARVVPRSMCWEATRSLRSGAKRRSRLDWMLR